MDNPVVALRGRFAELADGSLQSVAALIAEGRDVDAEMATSEDAELAAAAEQHAHIVLSKEEQIEAAIERRVRKLLRSLKCPIQDVPDPYLAAKIFVVLENSQAAYQGSGATARAAFEWIGRSDRRAAALTVANAAADAATRANAPTLAEEDVAWAEWKARPASNEEWAIFQRWFTGRGGFWIEAPNQAAVRAINAGRARAVTPVDPPFEFEPDTD